MRSWASRFLCVLILGVSSPCLAQQPTGPATLENLLKDEPPAPVRRPVAVDAAEQHRPVGNPHGTLVRPKSGVQHPDLERAWADYDAAVAKAVEGIKAAIVAQFDAAAAKGDLNAAEKWQAIGKMFETKGIAPAERETEKAVKAAAEAFVQANELLRKAYDDAMRTLTKEKRIEDAKSVRSEWAGLAVRPVGAVVARPADVIIEAKDFKQSVPAHKATREGAKWDGLTIPADTTLQYDVTLPKAGRYFVHVQYASEEQRPCDLVLNGSVIARGVLGENTGGSMRRNLRWATFGPIDFREQNVLAIDPRSHGPHYSRIVISESKDAPLASTP